MIGFAALFGTIVVAVGIVLGYVVAIADNVPPLSQLKQISDGANSTVYAKRRRFRVRESRLASRACVRA